MYPQGVLDIIHHVIIDNCPYLILNNCPEELLKDFPKDLLKSDPKEILENEQFKLHFKSKLPNEFNLKRGKRFISDMPFDTLENIIIGLEFQSSEIEFKDIRRFNVYQAELWDEYGKYVLIVVFSTIGEKHEFVGDVINIFDGFTMLNISLKALNGEKTLNNSSHKILNNIIMSEEEKALFLMNYAMVEEDKKVETLKETIRLTHLIKNIDSKERDDMLKIQINVAEEFFNDDDFKEIEVYGMAIELSESVINRIVRMKEEEIKEEGIDLGIEKSAKAMEMVKGGSSINDASVATGLSIAQVNLLCNLL